MKLLRSTENKTTKSNNGDSVRQLKITEIVLDHCNIVNNDYQQDSRVLYTFVPNKTFGSLLGISSKNNIFSKTFNSADAIKTTSKKAIQKNCRSNWWFIWC